VSGPAEGFWADVPFGPGVRLVARDENGLAALDKPQGMLSHPNGPRDLDRSLVRARYDRERECFEWPGPDGAARRLWLVNRLDSATSGLILAAAGEALALEIRALFRRRGVRKIYEALVFGKPRQQSEAWRDTLDVRKEGGRIRAVAGAGNLPAECRMTLVRSGSGSPRVSLIRLEPLTGRSHQLRVQCARRGLPIVGDRTYGDFAANRAFAKAGGPRRMFLHSLEIGFGYRFAGKEHAFAAKAPLPAEFARVD
jgi:23S rRNA-/tRNA-specific pseudouridylate synthase